MPDSANCCSPHAVLDGSECKCELGFIWSESKEECVLRGERLGQSSQSSMRLGKRPHATIARAATQSDSTRARCSYTLHYSPLQLYLSARRWS